MTNRLAMAVAIIGISSAMALSCRADEDESEGLAKALPEAVITLGQGLKAGEPEGRPISGKFEMEDGTLQLSVYTMKGEQFSEVIIDHKSGAIKKSEHITDADDLKDAKEQAEALNNAKTSLDQAVDAATRENEGYRAVSVTPSLNAGKPVANITLIKGDEVKKVTEQLE